MDLARAFSLGDAGEVQALLESAGFDDVTIAVRSYTVRQPRDPERILKILESVASFIPSFAAMNAEERSALAQEVQREIDPALAEYVQGDEELYPASVHIALAFKPQPMA